MSRRRLFILLATPLLVLGILLGALLAALNTTFGAHWILTSLQGQLPGHLESAELRGDLGSGLVLRKLSYRDPQISIKADQILLQLSVDFFPPAIKVDALKIQSLIVQALQDRPEGQPSENGAVEDILSSLKLRLPLELKDVQVSGFEYVDAGGMTKLSSKHLSATASLYDKIHINGLELDVNDHRFQLDGSIDLERPFPMEARLATELSLALPDNTGPENLTIQTRIEGNLSQEMDFSLAVQEPAVLIGGTLSSLFQAPEWRLELESPGFEWPLDSPKNMAKNTTKNTATSVRALQLHSEGTVADYTISATGRVQIADTESHQFTIQANGGPSGIQVRHLDLAGPVLGLTATAELLWQDEFRVAMNSTVNQLNPGIWLNDWPEHKSVDGEFSFELGKESLTISSLHFEETGSETVLNGSGLVDFSEGNLHADLSWRELAWPIGSDLPGIQSKQGNIQLSGTLDDWKMAGDIELESDGLPPGDLRLEAAGTRDHAEMTIVDGRILGGSLNGDAEFDWRRDGIWSARLLAQNINTKGLSPALSGTINADLNLRGKLEPFQLDLDINDLAGDIRNQPLTAAGRVVVQEGSLDFTQLQLDSGGSKITIDGSTNSTDGLEFSTDIIDLGTLLPNSSGSIHAQGRVAWQAANPFLRLDLEAREIIWGDVSLSRISINNSPQIASDTIAGLRIEGTELQFDNQQLDTVAVDLNFKKLDQSIRLTAQKSGLELAAELSGSLLQAGKPLLHSKWAGQVDSFELTDAEQLDLTLLNPAGIELAIDSASIASACLSAGSDSELCLDAGWQQNSRYFTRLKLAKMPLLLVQSLLGSGLQLSQYAEGELQIEGVANHAPSGQAMIRVSPGEIRYTGDTETLITTGEGIVSFELHEGTLSAGNLDIPLPGQGLIDLDFSVANVVSGLNSKLEGQLKIELADLDILTLFVPVISRAEGKFQMDLDLSGSPAHPLFTGQISLLDGLVYNQPSGLRLDHIELFGEVVGNKQTQLSGTFMAREGKGQLQAIVDHSDIFSPNVEISISGDNLTLLDAEDLKLVAEPDIQVAWRDGTIHIDGSLMIPKAHIAPSILPQATVSESPDLVIVAGELPGAEPEIEKSRPVAIRGNLEVSLGDEVELDLSVTLAKVNGSADFSWQDNLLPMANGAYSLEGQIQAFGQLLQITEADIRFPGIPADNPYLNIRAERVIYGNSEVRRAGVFVTGTLRRPVIEPYTDPVTNRERAQTLLVTGSDFNMETGVGAVNIGTYIAPRLFVSYGIGVFEDENVVSIRYDLGRNWGIKATSGQRQTGLDMSYTIDH